VGGVTPWWSALTWDVARAGGFVAYGLLTLAVVTGLLLSLKWQSAAFWPRLVNYELHRYLLTLALVFTALHVLAVAVDPFTAFRWYEVLVPGLSHYRPLWLAFGIVGLYLGLALLLSTWLQRQIGYRLWRLLHHAAFLVFLLITLHGLGTGSDSRTTWAEAVYGVAMAVVALLTALRLARSASPPMLRLVGGGTLAAVLVLGVLFARSGPLRPGWNRVANDGRGSGARVALSPVPSSFTAAFRGRSRLTERAGGVLLTVVGSLSGGARGSLQLVLRGEPVPQGLAVTGSRLVLREARPIADTFVGGVVGSRGQGLLAEVQGSRGEGLSLDLRLSSLASGGAVTGVVAGEAVP
jgi:hypothetical protein